MTTKWQHSKPHESRSEHCSITYARTPKTACSNADHTSKKYIPEQATAWVSEASDEAALSLQANVKHHVSTSFTKSSRMNLTQQNCQIFFGMYSGHKSYIRVFQDFQTKSLYHKSSVLLTNISASFKKLPPHMPRGQRGIKTKPQVYF